MNSRIYLSPPDVGPAEAEAAAEAILSGWVAPIGPELTAFEAELARASNRRFAVAVSSGTAALHLILLAIGVKPGDEVAVSTLTFVGSVNPIRYIGAKPVFVDSDPISWNMDVELLRTALAGRRSEGRRIAAVMAVDLYGRCANYTDIQQVCDEYEVPLVSDAAEAAGATHRDNPAGSFGLAAAFSFNGNKIITTSSGGAVLTDDSTLAERVRHLSTQARESTPHYEHKEMGFNYRLSNVLASIGRVQLSSLSQKRSRRLAIAQRYQDMLGDVPGIAFPDFDSGWNGWITAALISPEAFGCDRESIRLGLETDNIESRPTWKPMHLQPLFRGYEAVLNGVADDVWTRGLCLPSGSSLTNSEIDRVVAAVRRIRTATR